MTIVNFTSRNVAKSKILNNLKKLYEFKHELAKLLYGSDINAENNDITQFSDQ